MFEFSLVFSFKVWLSKLRVIYKMKGPGGQKRNRRDIKILACHTDLVLGNVVRTFNKTKTKKRKVCIPSVKFSLSGGCTVDRSAKFVYWWGHYFSLLTNIRATAAGLFLLLSVKILLEGRTLLFIFPPPPPPPCGISILLRDLEEL